MAKKQVTEYEITKRNPNGILYKFLYCCKKTQNYRYFL